VKNETSTVVFNASALDIGDASIYSHALQSRQTPSVQLSDKALERVTLQFLNPLPAGSRAKLQICFQGKITGAMMGYYKSSWEHEGNKKYYALTQFEVWLPL
jgi:aminopeptidase 2